MPIRVQCHKCHRTVKAGDDWAGRSAKCPSCGATLAIPQPDPARILGESAAASEDLNAWVRSNVTNDMPSNVAAEIARIDRLAAEPAAEMVDYDRRGEGERDGEEVAWARHRALLAKLDELKQPRVVVTEIRLRFENMVGLVLQFWFATLAAAFLVAVAVFVAMLVTQGFVRR